MSIFKTFLLLPFFKSPLFEINFRILKWVYLILKWNLGLPYFEKVIILWNPNNHQRPAFSPTMALGNILRGGGEYAPLSISG
jgi:hypothetical protein